MTTLDDGRVHTGVRQIDAALDRMRSIVPGLAPGDPGSADPELVRSALASLEHDDQRLLWMKHVDAADDLAVAQAMSLPLGSVQRRLRKAERAMSQSFAAVHARAVAGTLGACSSTRGSLGDYVRHRVPAGQRRVLEEHLFGCQECMRAFIDIRQAGWTLRDAAPALLAGSAGLAAAGPVVLGAMAGTAGSGGLLAAAGGVGALLGSVRDRLVDGFRTLLGSGTKGALVLGSSAAGIVAVAVVAAAVALGGGTVPPASADADDVAVVAEERPQASSRDEERAPVPEEPEAPAPELEPSPTPSPAPSPRRPAATPPRQPATSPAVAAPAPPAAPAEVPPPPVAPPADVPPAPAPPVVAPVDELPVVTPPVDDATEPDEPGDAVVGDPDTDDPYTDDEHGEDPDDDDPADDEGPADEDPGDEDPGDEDPGDDDVVVETTTQLVVEIEPSARHEAWIVWLPDLGDGHPGWLTGHNSTMTASGPFETGKTPLRRAHYVHNRSNSVHTVTFTLDTPVPVTVVPRLYPVLWLR